MEDIQVFKHRGVDFYNVMPCLEKVSSRHKLINFLINQFNINNWVFDTIIGIDSRGYTLATLLADRLNKDLLLVRKVGKLPEEKVVKKEYSTEYSQEEVEVIPEQIQKNSRMIVVDDLLATGGTIKATSDLVSSLGAKVIGIVTILDLALENQIHGLGRVEAIQQNCPIISYLNLAKPESHDSRLSANNFPSRPEKKVIFSGPTMSYFSNRLFDEDTRQGLVDWKTFPDGWPNIVFDQDLKNKEVYWILSPVPEELAREIALLKVLPRQGIQSLDIIIPYFPPSTMERVDQEGTLATAEPLAKMLSEIEMTPNGPVKIHLMDIHALPERFYFSNNVTVMLHSAIDLLIKNYSNQKVTVCFPDEGAYKRYYNQVCDYFPVVICQKERSGDKRLIKVPELDVSKPYMKHMVIVDDICHSGGTLYKCAQALKEQGVEKVEAFVVHMVGENNSYMNFVSPQGKKAIFDSFIISDSTPTSRCLEYYPPFKVISLCNKISQEIINSREKSDNLSIQNYNRLGTVAVATTSQLKLQALEKAFWKSTNWLSKHKWQIKGYETNSNVPEQPFGKEIINGANNRLNNLVALFQRHKLTKPDFYIAIESGIDDQQEKTIIVMKSSQGDKVKSRNIIHGTIPLEYVPSNQNQTAGQIISQELGVNDKDWHFRLFGTSRGEKIAQEFGDWLSRLDASFSVC